LNVALRPYQMAGVERAREHVRAGRKRVILCLPTAGGKTVVAAHIIASARAFDKKVLFVAHRLELIDQAVSQLARWGVTDVGVIRADDHRTNAMMPVQVATIQSLSRRSAPKADFIFIDECHRSLANSYLRLLEIYPDGVFFGLTATACRADGKPLKDFFQAIEPIAMYSDLVRDKFIVEPRCFGVEHVPDLSGVRTVAGDFVLDGLEKAMTESYVLGDTLSEYRAKANGRRTVIFACTVKHSRAIEEEFLKAGVRVAHVDASTPEDDRRAISTKLRTGEIEVVTNVGIYTEGWDEPSVKCLILARPTKSLVLYMQMCGRGLRPWSRSTPYGRSWQESDGPSEVPIIIDQGNNIDRHGFPHEDRTWTLEGNAQRKTDRRPTKCIKCRAYIPNYPCKECGFAPDVPKREVKEYKAISLEERKLLEAQDPRREFFNRMLVKARSGGFKPGYASAKYKEEYDEWPPWAWSQEAKMEFAKDGAWRVRQANHEKFASDWKKNGHSDGPAEYDSDETFADWYGRQ
jgi:DNA repair protein RadD